MSEPDTLHDPARDATALPLIRAAIDAGVPVLAICRGMQELNVAYGGTLHQRLHATTGFDDHRERPADPLERQYGPAHVVRFAPGGLLQRVARGAQEATVNSLHDQGIAQLGAGLVVEASAPDGLVEAVSVRGAHAFALGVQWHPEWRYAEQPLSRDIFAAFGAARPRPIALDPVGRVLRRRLASPRRILLERLVQLVERRLRVFAERAEADIADSAHDRYRERRRNDRFHHRDR